MWKSLIVNSFRASSKYLNNDTCRASCQWRKGGDSNSRGAFTPDSFQDCSIRPLWHPSVVYITLFLAFFQA